MFGFLAYSEGDKGLYCLACVLFPSYPKEGASRAELLITLPHDDRKDAMEDLRVHSQLQYHLDSESKMHAFLQTMQNPQTRIDVLCIEESQRLVKKNREYIKSTIKCLEFAGREGIAVRRHRDDSTSESEY